MTNHLIILAGGSDTRLWPASSEGFPEHFLDSGNGQSFLKRTVLRALSLPFHGFILIITNRAQRDEVVRHLSDLPSGRDRIRVFPEPEPKGTAPAITAGVRWLTEHGPAATTVLVMPADHLISPPDLFRDDIERAQTLAEEGYFVTFGITPTRPETAYGYIEGGEVHAPGRLVRSFREKPDERTAREFLASGSHYWNSGMFLFRLDTYLCELAVHAPAVAESFSGVTFGNAAHVQLRISIVGECKAVEQAYAGSPSISLDYAVMEKSGRAAMVDAAFTWHDIGCWDEYAALFAGNTPSAAVVSVDSARCFVMSDIPVALAGVEDLIVVMRNGKLLVCRTGASRKVEDLARRMADGEGERFS